MTKHIKKSLSVFLSAVILIGIFAVMPISASATQSRTENFSKSFSLSGSGSDDIVSVAAAQLGKTGSQLGYSEQWCADFVSDCAKLANQSSAIPASGYCPTLRKNITDAGGYYVDKYSAQKGDIVFYGNNGADHVEIVYAASNGNVSTYGGNSGSGSSLYARSVRQHPTQTQSIAYIVRPKYSAINKPTDVHLDKSQVWYDIQDDIVLYPHGNNADYFWISVYKDGNQIISQRLDVNSELRFSASQWGYGEYYSWITAANSAGGTDSKGISFSVVGAAGYSDVSVSSPWYDLSDTVSISVSPVCSKGQVIGIDKNGVERVVTENCDTTYTVPASQLGVGEYSAYFSVYNGSGGIDTKRVSFIIVDKPKEGAKVTSNKSNYSLNDKVEISVSASYSKGQVIGIDKNGIERVVTENCGTTYSIPASQLGRGAYTAYFSVYNGTGGYDTERISFAIDEQLLNPCISINKNYFSTNEIIKIYPSVIGKVNTYKTTIYDNNGNKIKTYENKDEKIEINAKELGAGTYNAIVTFSNYAFEESTDAIQFTVVNDHILGDLNSDGKISVNDVTELQMYISQSKDFSDEQKMLADYNQDGVIDINDATDIQRLIANMN